MTLLEGTNFPDFSSLQSELAQLLAPLESSADLRIQFPQAEFNIAADLPTITVSIKDISIYDKYLTVRDTGETALPVEITLAMGVYVPKAQDSALCYRLFSEAAALLAQSGTLKPQKLGCSELEYIPDLRHYCLQATVVMKSSDICEPQ